MLRNFFFESVEGILSGGVQGLRDGYKLICGLHSQQARLWYEDVFNLTTEGNVCASDSSASKTSLEEILKRINDAYSKPLEKTNRKILLCAANVLADIIWRSDNETVRDVALLGGESTPGLIALASVRENEKRFRRVRYHACCHLSALRGHRTIAVSEQVNRALLERAGAEEKLKGGKIFRTLANAPPCEGYQSSFHEASASAPSVSASPSQGSQSSARPAAASAPSGTASPSLELVNTFVSPIRNVIQLDDTRFVIAQGYGRLLLWDRTNQDHPVEIPFVSSTYTLLSGNRIVGMVADAPVVWEVGQPYFRRYWTAHPTGHNEGTPVAVLGLPNERLAVCGLTYEGIWFERWDLNSGQSKGRVTVDKCGLMDIQDLQLSPTAKRLFCLSQHTVKVWDLNNRECSAEIEDSDFFMKGMAQISEDVIATRATRGGWFWGEGVIKIWDLNTETLLQRFTHGESIHGLVVLNQGALAGMLASSADGKTVKIWDTNAAECVGTRELSGRVKYLFELSDGSLLGWQEPKETWL